MIIIMTNFFVMIMITINGPGRKYENDIIEQRPAARRPTRRPDQTVACGEVLPTAECSSNCNIIIIYCSGVLSVWRKQKRSNLPAAVVLGV